MTSLSMTTCVFLVLTAVTTENVCANSLVTSKILIASSIAFSGGQRCCRCDSWHSAISLVRVDPTLGPLLPYQHGLAGFHDFPSSPRTCLTEHVRSRQNVVITSHCPLIKYPSELSETWYQSITSLPHPHMRCGRVYDVVESRTWLYAILTM